jgi:hypothetical protein
MEPSQRHASIVASSKQKALPDIPLAHVHSNDVRGTHSLSDEESDTPAVQPLPAPRSSAANVATLQRTVVTRVAVTRAAATWAAAAWAAAAWVAAVRRSAGIRVVTPRT